MGRRRNPITVYYEDQLAAAVANTGIPITVNEAAAKVSDPRMGGKPLWQNTAQMLLRRLVDDGRLVRHRQTTAHIWLYDVPDRDPSIDELNRLWNRPPVNR